MGNNNDSDLTDTIHSTFDDIVLFFRHKNSPRPSSISQTQPPSSTSTSSTRPGATIYPPPTFRPDQSCLERTIEVTPLPSLGPNIYTNTRPLWSQPGSRGIYGGALVAQALLAAQKTIPEGLYIHSIHCYFLIAGDLECSVVYHVEDIRPASKSFATREVKAKQRGKTIFIAIASFQRTVRKGENKEIAEHQISMPKNVPPPQSLESNDDKLVRMKEKLEKLKISIEERKQTDPTDKSIAKDETVYFESLQLLEFIKLKISRDPFIWKKAFGGFGDHDPSTPIHERKVYVWVKSREAISGSSPANLSCNQLAALAYFSDSWVIGTVTRVNPQSCKENVGMMVSLDHTIYFHLGEDTKVDGDDEWLLMEMQSPWMSGERGLVVLRIWRGSDGRLLATCLQEDIVRLRKGADAMDEGMQIMGKGKSSHKL